MAPEEQALSRMNSYMDAAFGRSTLANSWELHDEYSQDSLMPMNKVKQSLQNVIEELTAFKL